MAHIHNVFDSNEHFVIDPVTRAIANSLSNKIVVMQFDHNSERFTFEIPKVDGHNMANCDRVEIHYINVDAVDKTLKSTGVYEVNDIQPSPNDNSVAVFSWLLSRNCTKYAGTLSFLIHFACTTDGVEDYAWNTAIFQSITIGNGMNNGAEVVEPFPDILAQWQAQLFSASETAVLNVTTAEANALAAIEAAGEAKKQSVLDSIPDEYEALSALADQNRRNKAGAIVLDAEGESVIVNDASDCYLRGLKLFGKSTQDGTPTPDAPVDIVSVENPVMQICGKNLLPDVATNESYSGVTIAVNEDGSLTINGTATATVYYAPYRFTFKKGVSYIMSGCPSGGSASTYFMYINNLGGVRDYGNGVEVNLQDDFTSDVGFCIHAGTTINNLTFKPMVRLSESPEGYEAHSKQNITVPHTLPGIPVTSGGNYTDANGQQWICDEVDLARGVYVQRIGRLVLDGNVQWHPYNYETTYYGFHIWDLLDEIHSRSPGLCNQFETVGGGSGECIWVGVSNKNIYAISEEWYDKGVDAWKAHLNVHPLEIIYARLTHVETPLSDAEINAFKALHSNKPNTTILNDAGAFMAVEYVADTKTYIDNKIKEMMEGVTE